MTDKIDIEKLARRVTAKLRSEHAKYGASYVGTERVLFLALTALSQEHNAEIARLEAGCAQCRAKHEADAKGLEARLAEYHEQVDRLMLDNASWESTCARLEAEITRLEGILSGDVMCKSMHYENGKCDLVLSHPIMASIIAEAVNMFDQGGGRNYVSFRTNTEQRGRFEIIIQRCGGKTPAEKNGELTAAVQLALDWRGLDGDGITDPTRQTLMDAIAPKEKGDKR